MRYALVDNETMQVVNVVLWDGVSAYEPPTGHTLMPSDHLQVGDTVDLTQTAKLAE